MYRLLFQNVLQFIVITGNGCEPRVEGQLFSRWRHQRRSLLLELRSKENKVNENKDANETDTNGYYISESSQQTKALREESSSPQRNAVTIFSS